MSSAPNVTPSLRRNGRMSLGRCSSPASSREITPRASISVISSARACDPASGSRAASASLRRGWSGSSCLSSHAASPASNGLREASVSSARSRVSAIRGVPKLPAPAPAPACPGKLMSASAPPCPWPCQRMAPPQIASSPRPCVNSHSARPASSAGSAFSPAASSNRRSFAPAAGSTWKRNPSSRPMVSPSTVKCPSGSNVTGSAPASCPSDFIKIVVLRLTNLSVSRACSASESFASTARARAAISSRASTQSGRWQI